MERAKLESVLKAGETAAVEFKRCENGIKSDVYETVCAFANHFGGDLFLGVEDDGTVCGVPEKAAPAMTREFAACVSNPALFDPTVRFVPEILQYEGKQIIHVHILPGSEVTSFKNSIYDRLCDADVKVATASQMAQLHIRKQGVFTERRIYPHVGLEDLRLDLLPRVRIMAANYNGGDHPWRNMSDQELLKSAHLYGTDWEHGQRGYTLAAVLLLGRDDVIADIAPSYGTDALLRKLNTDRYDDREIVKTNLIESYDQLFKFASKHLPDPFYLEGAYRRSLRSILVREIISNTLIHREYTSNYQAKFVIEKYKMYVENANIEDMQSTVANNYSEPIPKNPTIANFFRIIGNAEQLGTGIRNLFKYSKFYSGKDPEVSSGSVFRTVVPLDGRLMGAWDAVPVQAAAEPAPNRAEASSTKEQIVALIKEDASVSQVRLAKKLHMNVNTVKYHLRALLMKGLLRREGTDRKGRWIIADGSLQAGSCPTQPA